jgi:DNA-binding response OmpR family regulator
VKILVVEDDLETAAYVAQGLEQEGHVVDRVPIPMKPPRHSDLMSPGIPT